MNMGGGSHGGPPGFARELPPNFICKRCKVKGHHITECPENDNPAFDVFERKGCPVDERYKDLILGDIWSEMKGLVCKSLIKQKEIYDFTERIQAKEEQEDEDGQIIKATSGEEKMKDLPPSLKCQLCYSLIVGATMTPCCFSSCCHECLKSNLTSSANRFGVCPMTHCREQDILVQNLIPNHALNKAADWFTRQQVSMMDEVTLETVEEEKPGKIDVVLLGSKLLEEARTQATSGGEERKNIRDDNMNVIDVEMMASYNQAEMRLGQNDHFVVAPDAMNGGAKSQLHV